METHDETTALRRSMRSLTDETLADRLISMTSNPKRWSRADRDALILESAYRLDSRRRIA